MTYCEIGDVCGDSLGNIRSDVKVYERVEYGRQFYVEVAVRRAEPSQLFPPWVPTKAEMSECGFAERVDTYIDRMHALFEPVPRHAGAVYNESSRIRMAETLLRLRLDGVNVPDRVIDRLMREHLMGRECGCSERCGERGT